MSAATAAPSQALARLLSACEGVHGMQPHPQLQAFLDHTPHKGILPARAHHLLCSASEGGCRILAGLCHVAEEGRVAHAEGKALA